jgi:hypothetical protein
LAGYIGLLGTGDFAIDEVGVDVVAVEEEVAMRYQLDPCCLGGENVRVSVLVVIGARGGRSKHHDALLELLVQVGLVLKVQLLEFVVNTLDGVVVEPLLPWVACRAAARDFEVHA